MHFCVPQLAAELKEGFQGQSLAGTGAAYMTAGSGWAGQRHGSTSKME